MEVLVFFDICWHNTYSEANNLGLNWKKKISNKKTELTILQEFFLKYLARLMHLAHKHWLVVKHIIWHTFEQQLL